MCTSPYQVPIVDAHRPPPLLPKPAAPFRCQPAVLAPRLYDDRWGCLQTQPAAASTASRDGEMTSLLIDAFKRREEEAAALAPKPSSTDSLSPKSDESCTFCAIVAGRLPAFKVRVLRRARRQEG